jgi:hypothetical protein
MRSLETTFCYFWDYNLELTINWLTRAGSGALRCEMGLGAERVQGTGTHTLSTSEPDCLGLILLPVAPPRSLCTLHTFILAEVAVGHSHRHVWLEA